MKLGKTFVFVRAACGVGAVVPHLSECSSTRRRRWCRAQFIRCAFGRYVRTLRRDLHIECCLSTALPPRAHTRTSGREMRRLPFRARHHHPESAHGQGEQLSGTSKHPLPLRLFRPRHRHHRRVRRRRRGRRPHHPRLHRALPALCGLRPRRVPLHEAADGRMPTWPRSTRPAPGTRRSSSSPAPRWTTSAPWRTASSPRTLWPPSASACLSVHFIDGWAFDDPDQKARWTEPGAPDAIWRRYGELWCEAASNASLPYDAMSHPDLSEEVRLLPELQPGVASTTRWPRRRAPAAAWWR